MGSYIESALTKGENIVYQGKTSIWSLVPLIVLGLLFVGFFGIGLLFWAAAAIRYFTTELAITNKRVIAKFGLISRSTIEINIHKIESIQVNQGILGRIFNFRCRKSTSSRTWHFPPAGLPPRLPEYPRRNEPGAVHSTASTSLVGSYSTLINPRLREYFR